MERLKRERRPQRNRLNRLVTETDGELESEQPDLTLLRNNLQLLKDTMDSLEEVDRKIADQMLDDGATEEAQDQEFEAVDQCKKKFLTTKTKLEKILEVTIQPANSEFESADEGASRSGNRRNFKLPKVELQKFDGDLKHWLGWWSHFQKIDEDEELHNADKFQYLSQAMKDGTEAKELVDSYPHTSENYPKVIEALKDRFGRQDLLLQIYVRELLTLVISNVTSKEKAPLSSLYLKLDSHLRSLAALQLDKADPATWLFPLVESSLTVDTLRAWQRNPLSTEDGSKTNPKKNRLDQLMEFIKTEVHNEQQIRLAQSGFQSSSYYEKKKQPHFKHSKSNPDVATAAGLLTTNNVVCAFCEKNHDSDRCVKALSMSLEERKNKIKEKRLCFQCIRPGHIVKKCKSVVKCVVCGGSHYPILCSQAIGNLASKGQKERTADECGNSEERQSFGITPGTSGSSEGGRHPTNQKVEFYGPSSAFSNQCGGDVLLNTLKVRLIGEKTTLVVRLVGDTGSQRSFISRNALTNVSCEKVGEEWLQNVLFGGVTTSPQRHGKYDVSVGALRGSTVQRFQLLEKGQICGKIPCIPQGPWISEMEKIGIRPTDLGNGSEDVDILLGNDQWGKILTGRIVKLDCGLVATETCFGWTLGGRIPKSSMNIATAVTSMLATSQDISALWSLEAIGITDPISVISKDEEQQQALKHFKQTVERDAAGRYVVSLPWKDGCQNLPNNRNVAQKRLENATFKLKKEDKFADYENVFKSWEKEDFLTVVADSQEGHYLPHRPVFKNSETTPVRPVFDASCRSGRNPSLNDCLHKGPNLLEIIPVLLMRFRENKIGITADIRKAFQMLKVREEDQIFQKFLWWEDENCCSLKVYMHQRVVFGLNCSPFLLGAVINHHLDNVHEAHQPLAKQMKTAFYVDNLVSSLDTNEECRQFKEGAVRVMKAAGMDLRQWAFTQDRDLSTGWRVGEDKLSDEAASIIPVLGLTWDRSQDTISCEVKADSKIEKVTKRHILSVVSQIFDPVGFTAPAVLVPKLLLQESWNKKNDWDEELPEEMKRKFLEWMEEIHYLSEIKLQRHFLISSTAKREVHVFCDASKYAYGAVIFIRSEEGGFVNVQLVSAKSRLAPMKKATIPRLELMGCLIGSRMAKIVQDAIDCSKTQFLFWSDSTTALAWIKRGGDWGVFVSNRCREILTSTEPDQWRHVPGIHNPADLPSRGCSPRQLLDSSWWEGPAWLKLEKDEWPISRDEVDEDLVNEERKKSITLVAVTREDFEEPRFSSFRKNVAVWGWILRFVDGCRKREVNKKPYLSISEMRRAEVVVIQDLQKSCFPNEEVQVGGIFIQRGKDGLLRVMTKLTNRKDTEDFIRPIFLPSHHPLVYMLVRDMHRCYHHGGIQFLMSKIREKYWIQHSRRTIRRILKKCTRCRRHEAKAQDVFPASLPERRVETSEPFQTTGIDLAGPLFLRDGQKAWIVLFTCAVYRCVYLDVVTSLNTEAFLGALERFISVYGRPNTVYSDNGTNFVGASNIFKKLDWTSIEEVSGEKQIQWIFNPPTASWWGGWWERLVRSVKDLLKRMLGKSKLSYDELRTCLAGVTATINDRPLTVVTEDNMDLIPLTPAMFMRGRASGSFSETSESQSLQLRYRQMKNVQTQLKNRFRKEYLSQLVLRGNEKKDCSIAEGDVVLVGADNKKRFEWPLGLVLELLPGKDKKTRVARIKTSHGILLRPLQRLYPLEVSQGHRASLQERVKKGELQREKESENDNVVITKRGRAVKKPVKYGVWNK